MKIAFTFAETAAQSIRQWGQWGWEVSKIKLLYIGNCLGWCAALAVILMEQIRIEKEYQFFLADESYRDQILEKENDKNIFMKVIREF